MTSVVCDDNVHSAECDDIREIIDEIVNVAVVFQGSHTGNDKRDTTVPDRNPKREMEDVAVMQKDFVGRPELSSSRDGDGECPDNFGHGYRCLEEETSYSAEVSQEEGSREALDLEKDGVSSELSKNAHVSMPEVDGLVNLLEAVQSEDAADHSVTVRQMGHGKVVGSTMWVPVTIASRRIAAVVDSGAQVTLMSSRLFQQLGLNGGERVQLKNAKAGSLMEGRMVPNFGFQVGGKKYYWNVEAADIEDEFILGLDFFKGAVCKLDLVNDCLQMGNGETIHAMMKDDEKGDKYHVSRVLLKKRSMVAPGMVRFVKAKLENPASVRFVLEPNQAGALVIVPCLVEGDTAEVRVAVVNL